MKITDVHELFVKEFFNSSNKIIYVGIRNNELSISALDEETLSNIPDEYNGFKVIKQLGSEIVAI